MRRALHAFALLTALVATAPAWADPTPPAPAASPAPTTTSAQGVAVVASGTAARDDAFVLARTVYASSLRPRQLDELRARILAGDPPPPTASQDVRELAELRASVTSEDAASRRLLAAIAQQMHVAALLVVTHREAEAPAPGADAPAAQDGGAGDAGAAPAVALPLPSSAPLATARLFLADTGEFDAARYEPESAAGGGAVTWRGTVSSLASRFPQPTLSLAQVQGPPPKIMPTEKEKESHPFYTSSWFWGAVGAAAVIGGIFFLASQDTSSDPIHLQMRVPR